MYNVFEVELAYRLIVFDIFEESGRVQVAEPN